GVEAADSAVHGVGDCSAEFVGFFDEDDTFCAGASGGDSCGDTRWSAAEDGDVTSEVGVVIGGWRCHGVVHWSRFVMRHSRAGGNDASDDIGQGLLLIQVIEVFASVTHATKNLPLTGCQREVVCLILIRNYSKPR